MSTSSSDNGDHQRVPLCDCIPPHPAKLRVCWRTDNPARRFYNCRFSMYTNRPSCHFFDWVDPEVNEYYKGLIRRFRDNSNVAAVEAAQRKLAVAEEKLMRLNQEVGQLTVAKAKEKEKAAVSIAMLKKDIEALQYRGKVNWYIILGLVVVIFFLVLIK